MFSLRMLEPITADTVLNQLQSLVFGLKLLSSFPSLLNELRPEDVQVEVKLALVYCLTYSSEE